MGPSDDAGPETAARYENEDCRPTSKRELLGFYAYSCAAEAVVIAGISSFIPITLEELARGRGFLQSDRSIPCSAASGLPAIAGDGHANQCLVPFLGTEINTASFAMYTFSISVALQAVIVITMSGAADHGSYRKTLLLTFAVTGAVATMLFLFVTSAVYALAALWAIIANVCLGASFVLLNAYIPILVRWHPDMLHSTGDFVAQRSSLDTGDEDDEFRQNIEDDMAASTSRLLPDSDSSTYAPSPAVLSTELRLSSKISSYGIGFGYIAALVVQVAAIGLILANGSTTWSLRLVLFGVGVWWLALTMPAAYCLRPRPGPPLATSHGTNHSTLKSKTRTWLGYVTYSWKKLGQTIMRARKLKDVLFFLGAWFMISDAIATVSGTAILFAKTTLNMRPAALSLINITATLAGVVGAFSWSKLSRVIGLSPTQTILACMVLFEIIPLYGLLGFIPAIQRAGVGGLQKSWEMYPLGAVYGFVMGGLSSYCRSLFGELIPEGSEAAFYALYAVTDKGSSVFGPAVVGAITDATGEIRPAFWFLAILILLPMPLMMLVDVERGKKEAAAVADEIVPRAGHEDGLRHEAASE